MRTHHSCPELPGRPGADDYELPFPGALVDPGFLCALDSLAGDGRRELRLLEQENTRLLNALRRERPVQR